MLKSMVFKNFVHFKDKTIINLYASQKRQKENQSTNAHSGDILDCNALNIFVGANFCGKSTVLELIRRCMSEDVNASETRSYDVKTVAYAFCKFDLASNGEIVSGIIKDPDTSKEYKVFIYNDRTEKILRSKIVNETEIKQSFQDQEQQAIEAILNWNEDKPWDDSVKSLLDKIKNPSTVTDVLEEPNWKSLEEKYVATFALRGIGSVQWTKSKNIGERYGTKNYETACERAEIISKLLTNAEKSYIDEADEIFNFLTHPEIFEFQVSEVPNSVNTKFSIKVKHNEVSFELLKLSEGILEARITSLLLAMKDIKTLCLEDPDRGMHPQMIERLKTVLYQKATNKTIIVVTHSPYLIDTLTISRTHLFFRKKRDKKDTKYICSALKVREREELKKVSDMETFRTLLFATKVLLVEGVSDKEIVQIVLHNHTCKTLGESNASRDEVTHLSTYQVIDMGGFQNAAKTQLFCKQINLPCLCLMDLDTAVKVHDHKITRFMFLEGKEKSDFKKYLGEELSAFINCKEDFMKFSQILESKKNLFIWRYGTVEDAILSSGSVNDGIAKALNMLDAEKLKERLQERLSEEERDMLSNELIKIEEIQRFIRFLKKEEISQ